MIYAFNFLHLANFAIVKEWIFALIAGGEKEFNHE